MSATAFRCGRASPSCGRAGTPTRRAPTWGLASTRRSPPTTASRSCERVREEFVSGTRGGDLRSLQAVLRGGDAAITARTADRARARRRRAARLPRSQWSFVDARTIKLRDGAQAQAGLRSTNSATRPRIPRCRASASPRRATSSAFCATTPAAIAGHGRPISHALAFGISQAGRYLRDHILRRASTATSRAARCSTACLRISPASAASSSTRQFGQPARTGTQHEDHGFPENEFPSRRRRSPIRSPARTARCSAATAAIRKLIETNTSTEYWQKGASLLHTDPLGTARRRAAGECARVYMIAGTQHGGRAGCHATPGPCINPRNPHDPDAGDARAAGGARRMGGDGQGAAASRAADASPTARWSRADKTRLPCHARCRRRAVSQ